MEIDFTESNLDYEQFLLQEFFMADEETSKKLSDYYYDIYGARSLAYITRNTSGWITGNYHLTNLMRERITSMMPMFLNKKAKHKLGIHEFMNSIKNTVNSFQVNQKAIYRSTSYLNRPQEVILTFEKEYEKIQTLKIRNFKFNVLTDDEKLEALEISKYILEIKLQKEFDQIERDFKIFFPHMSKFRYGYFSAEYSIKFFNLKVDITNSEVGDIEIPKFKIKEIDANSRFKEYSDKYLAYELLSIHKEANKAVNNSFLNSNDIKLFFTHYKELSKGESEVNINSNFQGEGGVLSLNAKFKPLKLLRTLLIISSIKLVIYLIVLISLVLLMISVELFILLYIGGFFLSIIVLSSMNEEIQKFKSLNKEFKLLS